MQKTLKIIAVFSGSPRLGLRYWAVYFQP